MYLDFYGLKEKPFTLSPNPKFLYYSPKHKEAISQFIFAVYEQSGFVALTGEVGTGKTMLINALIKSLPKDYTIININHKIISTKSLVQNICKELGIDFSKKTATELFIMLREYLEKTHKEGKKTILILDEAQNLSQSILEDIRLLSNFEAIDRKYLQIFIVGQPELDEKLEDVNMRQLKERISLRYYLKNLNRKETGKYINHRLKVAGRNSEKKLYTEDAIDYIYEQTEGIPRRINIMCENALLMAYATNSEADKPVDRMNLETNLTDIEASEIQAQQTPSLNEADSNGGAFDANVPVDQTVDAHEAPTQQTQQSKEPIGKNENSEPNVPLSHNYEVGNKIIFEKQSPDPSAPVMQSHQAPPPNQANMEKKNSDIKLIVQHQSERPENNRTFEKPLSSYDRYKVDRGPELNDITHSNMHQMGSFSEPKNAIIKDDQIEKLINVILNNMVLLQKPSMSQVVIGALVVFVLFILAFFLAFLFVGTF